MVSIDSVQEINRIKADKLYADMSTAVGVIQEKALKLTVTDKKTESKTIDFISDMKKLSKRMDDYRKKIIDEPGKIVNFVNKFFNPKIKEMGNIEAQLRSNHLNPFYQELDRKERKKQADIEAANQKKIEKYNNKVDEAEGSGKDVDSITLPKTKDIPTGNTITTTNKSKSVRIKKKIWKLVDIKKVPREYLMLDEKKINRIFKDIEIPGIEVSETFSARIS